jgi:hypothetical protein
MKIIFFYFIKLKISKLKPTRLTTRQYTMDCRRDNGVKRREVVVAMLMKGRRW